MAEYPVVGRDRNIWGDKLKAWDFVSHNPDGTLKDSVVTDIRSGLASDEDVTNLQNAVDAQGDTISDLETRTGTVLNSDGTFVDSEVMDAVVREGGPTGLEWSAAQDAIEANADEISTIQGGATLVLYDDFSTHSNGTIAGKTPHTGPSWGGSGSPVPSISSGRLVGSGTGYAYATLDDPVNYIEATQVFTGTGNANTLSWAETPFGLGDLIHLIYSSSDFTLTVRQDSGAFVEILGGSWSVACNADGTTPYRVGMGVVGNAVVVFGPNGEVRSTADASLRDLASSPTVFWQPTTDIEISSVRAIRYPIADLAASLISPLDMAQVAAQYGKNNQIVGSLNSWYEVSIGQTGNGMPGVVFGPDTIITRLTSTATAGASSITTERPIYGATTVKVGLGAGAENVTLSGAPSPLPGVSTPPTAHTQGISGTLSNTHPAGTPVYATGLPRQSFYFHPFVGGLWTSNDLMVGGNVYIGHALDTSLQRSAGGVIETTSQIKANGALTTMVKAGAPDDLDITSDSDGSMVVDTSNSRLYVRVGGTWKYVDLT